MKTPKAIYTITKNEKTINILITFEGLDFISSFLEIEGRIIFFSGNESFEPSWFSGTDSEEYYNNNWEAIEEIVLNQVNS